jgi:hypothetical protein
MAHSSNSRRMALINNWDLKDVNNTLYEDQRAEGLGSPDRSTARSLKGIFTHTPTRSLSARSRRPIWILRRPAGPRLSISLSFQNMSAGFECTGLAGAFLAMMPAGWDSFSRVSRQTRFARPFGLEDIPRRK